MADRALRGMGLGAKSFEDEEGIEFAARQTIEFDCTKGPPFDVTAAMDADPPTEWECPRCGANALRSDGTRPEEKETKHQRTHWDMLRERRSIKELEVLLDERLELLRSTK